MIKRKKVVKILKYIKQGQTIGIIGGGQLGQMLALDAKENGMKVLVLDPNPTCSAGQVADAQIVAAYDDFAALQQLAKQADVVTYEFENVDLVALEKLEKTIWLPQGTELLKITKNRLTEKTFLKEQGLDVVDFCEVNDEQELKQAVKKIGYPCILKTCEGGYDGKSQVNINDSADLNEAGKLLRQGKCILEGWLDFSLECSVMVARNLAGEITVFPVSENIHRNHILHLSIVPARIAENLQQVAKQAAVKIAKSLDLCGILGVEMFVGKDGRVYINELAPRPHNSGHYSIEACDFSQFAIHNRAICGWPLPQITLLKPVVMVNVLGQHICAIKKLIQTKPSWHFHNYGKDQALLDRKMGHVTILTDDLDKTLVEIEETKVWSD